MAGYGFTHLIHIPSRAQAASPFCVCATPRSFPFLAAPQNALLPCAAWAVTASLPPHAPTMCAMQCGYGFEGDLFFVCGVNRWSLQRTLNSLQGYRVCTVVVHGIDIGDDGAQALAALKCAPALHTLTLNLRGNTVGDKGVQALAALKEAPCLHTLTVELSDNAVGPSGARALAALKEAQSLQALTLNLRGNTVGDIGAQVRKHGVTGTLVLQWLTTIGGAPPPPPRRRSDHCGKKRNLQLGKSGRAIFGTQNFGSQTFPPSSLLVLA